MRKSNAEYIAKARETRLKQGLKRVEVWVPAGTVNLLKQYAETLREQHKP